jgi:Terpene cyclase DEP1
LRSITPKSDPAGVPKQEIVMSTRLILLSVVIAGFAALSAEALMEAGYFGLVEQQLRSWAGIQVLVDLVIVSVLACIWMSNDARERGLSAWPFIVITLVGGSFGPLLYLVVREVRSTATRSPISGSRATL